MVRKIVGSVPLEFEYFDKDGVQLNAAGQPMAELEKKDFSSYLEHTGETAQDALERYQAFFDAAFQGIDGPDFYRLEVRAPLATDEEITELENRIGVTMPRTWKQHVTRHGFFKLAGTVLCRAEEVQTLITWLASEMQVDDEADVFDFFDFEEQTLKKSVRFAFFDSEAVCFRLDVDEGEEAPIATLYHDDQDSFPDDYETVSFDELVSKWVDEAIRDAAKSYRLPLGSKD